MAAACHVTAVNLHRCCSDMQSILHNDSQRKMKLMCCCCVNIVCTIVNIQLPAVNKITDAASTFGRIPAVVHLLQQTEHSC